MPRFEFSAYILVYAETEHYALPKIAAVYSYVAARDTAGKIIVIPKLEIDNTEVERGPLVSASEDELLKKFPHLHDLGRAPGSGLGQLQN